MSAGVVFAIWTGDQKQVPVHTVSIEQQTVAAPTKLTIPKLGIVAAVESVGMDSQGRMDVPKNADNVAWYNLGYKPGDLGNAVIAGHYDRETGAPAVFYDINKLQVGDKIITTDVHGKEISFSVIRNTNYPYEQFPLKEVFGSSSKPMLNLITCEGTWNKITHNYSHRTVVFAEMIKQ